MKKLLTEEDIWDNLDYITDEIIAKIGNKLENKLLKEIERSDIILYDFQEVDDGGNSYEDNYEPDFNFYIDKGFIHDDLLKDKYKKQVTSKKVTMDDFYESTKGVWKLVLYGTPIFDKLYLGKIIHESPSSVYYAVDNGTLVRYSDHWSESKHLRTYGSTNVIGYIRSCWWELGDYYKPNEMKKYIKEVEKKAEEDEQVTVYSQEGEYEEDAEQFIYDYWEYTDDWQWGIIDLKDLKRINVDEWRDKTPHLFIAKTKEQLRDYMWEWFSSRKSHASGAGQSDVSTLVYDWTMEFIKKELEDRFSSILDDKTIDSMAETIMDDLDEFLYNVIDDTWKPAFDKWFEETSKYYLK